MAKDSQYLKIRATVAELIKELRRGITQYICYQIAFFIVSVLVLSPISSLIFTFLIKSTGVTSITNEDIICYIFSLRGALTLSVWVVITFFLIFTEQSGIILICSKARFREKTAIIETMTFAMRKIHIIMKLGANLFLRFALFSLPFLVICGTTYFTLLTDYDINHYYVQRPPAFWVSLSIAGLSLIGYLILLLQYLTRWIFILHLTLLENEPVAKVFGRSGELVQGVGMQILKILVLWIASIWAFITVTTAGYAFINSCILGIIGPNPKSAIFIMSFLYILDFILSTFLILLVSPVFSIVLTQLYYRRLHATGLIVPEDINSKSGLYSSYNGFRIKSEKKRNEYNCNQDLVSSLPGLSAVRTGKTENQIGFFSIDEENPTYFRLFQKVALRVVIVMVLISVVILGIFLAAGIHKLDRIEVTAHRGSSTSTPENTLSAIRQAIADQADYAEIDVQETLDGVVVVLHDSDLMRVTGKKRKIWKTTFAKVRELDAGSWFSPEFVGERIPTLEEAVEVAKDKIKLNIELKFYGHNQRLTERVVSIIKAEGFVDQCIVMSTNYQELFKVKELDNRIKVGFVFFEAIGKVFDLEVDIFSIFRKKATKSFITKARKREKEVHVWLINTPEAMEHFIYLGVDNIITDNPAKLVAILKRRSEMNDIDRFKENFLKWLKR